MKPVSTNRSIVVWQDDVLYPAVMYRESACRAGADLIQRLFRMDLYDALLALYRPGAEASSVRKALRETRVAGDDRLVRKVSECMVAHTPCIAPYEDALETFGMLQAMGIPMGLIGEGPTIGQRLVAERLGAERLFQHIGFFDPRTGAHAWQDALMLMELCGGIAVEGAVMICADPARTQALAAQGWRVYHVDRRREAPDGIGAASNIVPTANLYDLPEALGLVAWEDASRADVRIA